jgi:N-acetylmuramoyl-L-alanine amidase
LSNQEEAAFLASDAYLDRISDALLQSILEYQQTLTRSPSFTAENND